MIPLSPLQITSDKTFSVLVYGPQSWCYSIQRYPKYSNRLILPDKI